MTSRNDRALVEISNLTRQYPGVIALDQLSLEIGRGEWVAIMGPSGSGKTTLLNILSGLDRPDSGSVIVDGQDLNRISSRELATYRREKVGLVFQQFHLMPHLNALENVMLAQYYHSLPDEEGAREALQRVGLGDRVEHRPRALSGGEQQRVCIARALINEPVLVLADEPTGNLDEENQSLVMALFAEIHAAGRTIVMVTHSPEIAGRADRVIALHHGKLDTSGGGLVLGEDESLWPPSFLRRHRLAERLLVDLMQISPESVHDSVDSVMPLLDGEGETRICTLLGHPRRCPHGDPIPVGACCPADHDRS
ncbi:MAG TPA: ATP-binding cassette domain-containing protein [Armatimonadota bacterium]|nr:ATP-binding cassette domain-containing protein [Armatimonadota bacterium]